MDQEEVVYEQELDQQEPVEQAEEAGEQVEAKPEEAATEQEQTEEVEQPKRKPGSQREREKRLAAERRLEQVERELAQMRAGNTQSQHNAAPRLEDFNSVEEYVDFQFKQREEARKQQEMAAAWSAKEKKARQEIEDFDDAFEDFVSARPGRDLVEAVMESDMGPALAAYLGNNPDELSRLQSFSPRKQMLELGKIEDRISKPKKEVKSTKAPAPISPVKPAVPTKATKSAPRFGDMY
jgi:hypothetical protein